MAGRFNARTAVARPGATGRNGRIGNMMAAAAVVSIIAIIIVLIAFATPVWLEADRNMVSNPVPPFNIPFDKMGLWQFCFRLYQIGDPFLRYSIICRWYFSSGWPPMMEFLAPSFFIATQVIYTIGFILCIVGMVLLIAVLVRGPNPGMLFALGALFMLAAIFICISFIIFAARVFDREWIFGWQSNYLSWSFALAVAGGILLWICGALFLIEGRRAAYANEQGGAVTVVHRPTAVVTSEPAVTKRETAYTVAEQPIPRKTHPEHSSGGDREYKNIQVKAPILPPKPSSTNGDGNTYSYEYRREYNYAYVTPRHPDRRRHHLDIVLKKFCVDSGGDRTLDIFVRSTTSSSSRVATGWIATRNGDNADPCSNP
ncbi:hypothetical protein BV898_09610 [Hypsibius exemplaris]|uniref:Uncharacterized protein n=1 Tax=Hypsibius exemplaris TaxID=2072580 RepID=A0A1W0WM96_HYPEX|nr:hypothetical protein BV898_09610 [Hypsibius exemplaris]